MLNWNEPIHLTKLRLGARLLASDLEEPWSHLVVVTIDGEEELLRYSKEGRSRKGPEWDVENLQKLDLSCPVMTKNGRPVTILTTTARTKYPVIGLVHYKNSDSLRFWKRDGTHGANSDGLTLQNVQPQLGASALPTGVNLRRGRYYARIKKNGRDHHLGVFDTVEDAVAARSAASQEI